MTKIDVVIISQDEDKRFVEEILPILQSAKIATWHRNLLSVGVKVSETIQQAYKSSSVFICFITPKLLNDSDQLEAIEQILANSTKVMFPILISATIIEYSIFKDLKTFNTKPLDELNPVQRRTIFTNISEQIKKILPPIIPNGWRLFDYSFVETQSRKYHDLSIDEQKDRNLSFFDGRQPDLLDAVSPEIPRRNVVERLIQSVLTRVPENKPITHFLQGAGGEGKSIALMQTCMGILENKKKKWFVLWHMQPEKELPVDFISKLIAYKLPEIRVLIACDDADLVATNLLETAKFLYENERSDVNFLLAARNSDWNYRGNSTDSWRKYSDLVPELLKGIDDEDAIKIVEKWQRYDADGMGKLTGLGLQDAADKLIFYSKSEKSQTEGAFLGAMLRSRYGEDISEYVKRILLRLNDRPIEDTDKTLLDAFAYIAAAHAENILTLYRRTLAQVLGVVDRDLNKKVLKVLGEESAIYNPNEYVLIRHRAIAEAAIKLLEDSPFDKNSDDLLADLVETVCKLRTDGVFVPEIKDWRYNLPDYCQKSGRQVLAVRILKILIDEDKTDPQASQKVVKLAKIYRDSGQPELGITEFSKERPYMKKHRSFYFEWAMCEKDLQASGYWMRSLWLSILALADQVDTNKPDAITCSKIFTGIINLLEDIHVIYPEPKYSTAIEAALSVGLCINPSDQVLNQIKYKKGIATVDCTLFKTNLDILISVILNEWRQWENKRSQQTSPIDDYLPDWILPMDKLKFNYLKLWKEIDVKNEV